VLDVDARDLGSPGASRVDGDHIEASRAKADTSEER
jgi:hypothetical protein